MRVSRETLSNTFRTHLTSVGTMRGERETVQRRSTRRRPFRKAAAACNLSARASRSGSPRAANASLARRSKRPRSAMIVRATCGSRGCCKTGAKEWGAHARRFEGLEETLTLGEAAQKSGRRLVMSDGDPESRHQTTIVDRSGLPRFIIFTGPYPAARFGSARLLQVALGPQKF